MPRYQRVDEGIKTCPTKVTRRSRKQKTHSKFAVLDKGTEICSNLKEIIDSNMLVPHQIQDNVLKDG